MVVHIVMIKFKDGVLREQMLEVKSEIEALKDKIDAVESMEVGLNFADEDRAMDLALISTFKSREDLNSYAKDPIHLEVIKKIKSVADYTKVVDYEK
jgi:hypothetical protein